MLDSKGWMEFTQMRILRIICEKKYKSRSDGIKSKKCLTNQRLKSLKKDEQ